MIIAIMQALAGMPGEAANTIANGGSYFVTMTQMALVLAVIVVAAIVVPVVVIKPPRFHA